MLDAWLETFREVAASSATLDELHPLKLDRWHRALVQLPDALYMQMSCQTLLEQVRAASSALGTLIELLGADNLPADASELARRHIKTFSWHLGAEFASSGTLLFTVGWDKGTSSWKLECDGAPNTTKQVPDVETALGKATSWLEELRLEQPDESPPE